MSGNIKSRKAREYYLSLLGVIGEIPSLKAYAYAPAPPTTAGDELRQMKKDGLIRHHSHADRVRTFRISEPAGYEAIRDIDERLFEHTEILVGKKGGRYPGSKDYRIKKRKEAILMYDMLRSGFTVDGARLDEGLKLEIMTPDMTSAEKIIKSADEKEILFLSGMLLKKRNSAVTLTRREMSTSTGALFSKGGTYITYTIGTSRYRWYMAAEISSANEINRLYQDARGEARQRDGRFRAIVYTDTDRIAYELMKLSASGTHKMDPTSIYKLTYLVPVENRDFAMDVTKMLTIPDWRRKADAVLGLEPSGKKDGETEDGRKIYNLLCCNMAKQKEVSGEISRGKCELVIHDWQKPLLEELYGTEIEATVLTPRHFKGLLAAVEEK